jgi:hypothetical protein
MPYTILPPGYQAVLVGSATVLEDLGTFAPLEQSSDEGALFLARLDFTEFPSEESLTQLELALQDAGVERWPGYNHVVYADASEPGVYLVWQKGFAWLPIIIGLVATVVLPPLLGSVLWWILPQDIKDLITGIINLGMMMLIMFILMQVMKPLTASQKPRKVEQAKEIEEART